MDVKQISKDAGWYRSYMRGEQGKALVSCQSNKIRAQGELIDAIKCDLDLIGEVPAELLLESIMALVDQAGDMPVESSCGYFKWEG